MFRPVSKAFPGVAKTETHSLNLDAGAVKVGPLHESAHTQVSFAMDSKSKVAPPQSREKGACVGYSCMYPRVSSAFRNPQPPIRRPYVGECNIYPVCTVVVCLYVCYFLP